VTPDVPTTDEQRCRYTGLGRPECHCDACIQALIATHAPHLAAVRSLPRPPAAPLWEPVQAEAS